MLDAGLRLIWDVKMRRLNRHTKSRSANLDLSSERFEHIDIDIVGPLQVSKGSSYILTAVDRFICWSEAYFLKDMTVHTVARAFVSQLVSHFSVSMPITRIKELSLSPGYSRNFWVSIVLGLLL